MGMLWCLSSVSAVLHDIELDDGGRLRPAYVVVYVQSYGFVGTVWGIGVVDEGPMLVR